ncbi:MAG: hypothetical protein WAV54_05310, partial [Acidimicrobiales bacterium]
MALRPAVCEGCPVERQCLECEIGSPDADLKADVTVQHVVMFTRFVMRDVILQDGRLCRPDDLTATTIAPGGGRKGGLPLPVTVRRSSELVQPLRPGRASCRAEGPQGGTSVDRDACYTQTGRHSAATFGHSDQPVSLTRRRVDEHETATDGALGLRGQQIVGCVPPAAERHLGGGVFCTS